MYGERLRCHRVVTMTVQQDYRNLCMAGLTCFLDSVSVRCGETATCPLGFCSLSPDISGSGALLGGGTHMEVLPRVERPRGEHG